MAVVGPAHRHLGPRRGLPARAAGGAREGRHGRVRASPAAASSAAGRWRWWPTSSASSPARSGGTRRAASPPPYGARPPRGCRSWPPRRRAAPACRRAPRPSWRWSRSPGRSGPTGPPGCPTSCTCGTRPPAACTRRGDRSATSPSPSPARWSASSGPRSSRRSTASRSRTGCSRPRTSPPRASSTPSSPPSSCPSWSTGRSRVLLDRPDAAVPAAARPDGPHRAHGVGVRRASPGCPDRAGVRDLLRYGATDTLRLCGTDEGERDETVVIALTRLDGQPCVLVGQDRTRQGAGLAMGPGALREARRAMNLAEELGLPLVTVIDTPGAELSVSAEERAVAGEIARCIATMTRMRVPSVAILLGQGCGGGALALLPARRVLAAAARLALAAAARGRERHRARGRRARRGDGGQAADPRRRPGGRRDGAPDRARAGRRRRRRRSPARSRPSAPRCW